MSCGVLLDVKDLDVGCVVDFLANNEAVGFDSSFKVTRLLGLLDTLLECLI